MACSTSARGGSKLRESEHSLSRIIYGCPQNSHKKRLPSSDNYSPTLCRPALEKQRLAELTADYLHLPDVHHHVAGDHQHHVPERRRVLAVAHQHVAHQLERGHDLNDRGTGGVFKHARARARDGWPDWLGHGGGVGDMLAGLWRMN